MSLLPCWPLGTFHHVFFHRRSPSNFPAFWVERTSLALAPSSKARSPVRSVRSLPGSKARSPEHSLLVKNHVDRFCEISSSLGTHHLAPPLSSVCFAVDGVDQPVALPKPTRAHRTGSPRTTNQMESMHDGPGANGPDGSHGLMSFRTHVQIHRPLTQGKLGAIDLTEA